MLRSFKLKMALFSLGTSGVILLAFATLFMSAIRRSGLDRVDHHLLSLLEGQLRRPGPEGRWSRLDESLSSLYGESNRRGYLIRVIGFDGNARYTSPDWPAALDVSPLVPRASDFPEAPRGESGPPRRAQFPGEPPSDTPSKRLDPPERPFDEPGAHPPDGEPPRMMRHSPPRFQTFLANGRSWRFAAMRSPDATLLLGTDMVDLQAELRRFEIAYAMAVPLGLLLLATGGWLLAKQALRPVQILTQVAGSITAKGLDQRVPSERADQEFQALIDVINGMLNRLEVSFRQAARFSADAAHELKTPLTILQGQLNQAIRSAPSDSNEQRTYADLLDEVQRLKSIVRKLLLLAQSDAGQLRLSAQEVCLNAELGALFEDLPLLAPGLALECHLEPDVRVTADPDLLRQALQNLISNAVKYNRADGTVVCTLRREGGQALLSVANTTPPGARIERERLFDRFYRGDAAHNRKVDGTGLGLSLAREISRAHGGDLTLEESRDGWIGFRLTLPLAAAARTA